jgi:hypothetical protein
MSALTTQPARRRLAAVAIAAAAAALLATATPAAAQARASASSPGSTPAASGGAWGTAKEVPGGAALNKGGDAVITSVSCASTGNCSAGGFYTDSTGHRQVFVVSQVGGKWGTAKEVPGTATLNNGGSATLYSVSCASAGNCSAGGDYVDNSGHQQAFVVSQAGGKWGTAEEVPGAATLSTGYAVITSVSCASAGNCSAGGDYFAPSANKERVFVVSQVGGKWDKVKSLGIAPSNNTFAEDPDIIAVSCASAGNCSAGGGYADSSGFQHTFVVSQVNGTWDTFIEIPGAAQDGRIFSVSCASAGNCSAGGETNPGTAFVVSQVGGKWGKAVDVSATLGTRVLADVQEVSCASAGNCSAGGQYFVRSGFKALVVSQVGGKWGTAVEVPGFRTLNQGSGQAGIYSVSCTSAGNCSAGGGYSDSSNHQQAFVVSQVGGKWGQAREVPGTATLDTGGDAAILSLSCAPAGSCSAGGTYSDSSGHQQAFVVSQS